MSILPVTNIVNVTITNNPQGMGEKNVNSVALFTHEPTASLDPFQIYVAGNQVAVDYGTSSLTARMASAVFAQNPNIRTGNGRLVVIPITAVPANSGEFTTANISANLPALILVDSGDIRVTVDGINYDLTGLNFTNCENFEDIAKVINSRILAASVETFEESGSSGLTFRSKKVGLDSTVVLSTVPGGSGTALSGSGYFNAAGGTAVTGSNSSGETIEEAIARTDGIVGYVPVMTTLSIEDDAVESASDYIQGLDKLFHHAGASPHDVAGIGKIIADKSNRKTRYKVYTQGVDQAKIMNAAYVGRGHCVNFNGSQTSMTMNLKALSTIEPDTGINQSLYNQAEIYGVDLYVSFDGVPSVFSTGGNDYFDNVYNDLALKFALETAGFNFLRQTGTKIPQTENGMNGLKSAYAQVCERFTNAGAIAPGVWGSSDTFGDPTIFRNNIETRGYYVYSMPIVQQSSVERQSRRAPLVQIAIKRSGAIHSSDVIVLVQD